MTPDHDIERVLDRWFTEGPTQMPDRFLADTLGRIDRAPRQRLAVLRMLLTTRVDLRLAAAAGLMLVAVGVGGVLLTRSARVGAEPSSSPSVPAALQDAWTSVGRVKGLYLNGSHLIPTDWRPDITIGPSEVIIPAGSADLVSSASLVQPDTLVLGTSSTWPAWDCQPGDAGTYTFRLSPDSGTLTLTALTEACATRATLLAGDWVRSELGDLAAGRHASPLFKPFGTTGQLAYTLPAGWTGVAMQDGQFALGMPGVSDLATVSLFANASPSAQDDCSVNRGADGVGRTPAAIAAWLKTLPGLVVSTPTAVTIGGLSGIEVDLTVMPGWTPTCDAGLYTLSVSGAENGGWSDRLRLSGTDRARYALLERGDGTSLVLAIEAPNADWDTFITEAMPVVETFEFAR